MRENGGFELFCFGRERERESHQQHIDINVWVISPSGGHRKIPRASLLRDLRPPRFDSRAAHRYHRLLWVESIWAACANSKLLWDPWNRIICCHRMILQASPCSGSVTSCQSRALLPRCGSVSDTLWYPCRSPCITGCSESKRFELPAGT